MTKAEFEQWRRKTASSAHHWTVDIIAESKGQWLIYKGGENGYFIRIIDGLAEIGTYEGAIPHIGEALFTILYSKQFDSNEAALQAMIERGGLKFLTDIMGYNCYT